MVSPGCLATSRTVEEQPIDLGARSRGLCSGRKHLGMHPLLCWLPSTRGMVPREHLQRALIVQQIYMQAARSHRLRNCSSLLFTLDTTI